MKFSVWLAITVLIGCSEAPTVYDRIAEGFYRYQHQRNLGQVEPGTAMCVIELVNEGYLSPKDSMGTDAVVSLDVDRVVVVEKDGCKKLSLR